MEAVSINDQAYEEFKSFLDENKVDSFNIRINLAGTGCSGPVFNISVSEPTDQDITQVVNDITFIVDKELVNEFAGFYIISSEENGGRGLSLKPIVAPEGGCASCGGGCH